jgi:hypothetical protein
MKLVTTFGMSAAVALLAGSAFAQVSVGGSADTATGVDTTAAAPAPAPAPAPEPAPAPVAVADSNQGVGVGLPSAAPAAGDSDHSQMVGRLAVGYMGTQTMPLGYGPIGPGTVTAPVIGARYWIDNMLGIDAGIGFLWSTGSNENGATKTDNADVTAFILHAGVPLNLADAGHFSFQIIPEANIGFAGTGDQDADPILETTASGFLLNIGARAGGEVHFGFMGVPQLSLTGSVGLFLNHTSGGAETSGGGTTTEFSNSSTSLGTTLGPDPWDLFTGNISALYYF